MSKVNHEVCRKSLISRGRLELVDSEGTTNFLDRMQTPYIFTAQGVVEEIIRNRYVRESLWFNKWDAYFAPYRDDFLHALLSREHMVFYAERLLSSIEYILFDRFVLAGYCDKDANIYYSVLRAYEGDPVPEIMDSEELVVNGYVQEGFTPEDVCLLWDKYRICVFEYRKRGMKLYCYPPERMEADNE